MIILGTVSYIKETDDSGILDEIVPFDNDISVARSLFDHLTVSFDHVVNNLGPHGLPLIGRTDWNDCLNLNCFSNDPNESFQTTENKTEGSKAESVMIAGLFVVYGRKIGSNENEEAKIFIESNGWCTMAGIGKEEGLCTKALHAVKEW